MSEIVGKETEMLVKGKGAFEKGKESHEKKEGVFEKGKKKLIQGKITVRKKAEELLVLWIMLAFLPMVLVVDQGDRGIEFGFLTMVFSLVVEGFMQAMKPRLAKIGWWISYLVLLLCLSGITALVLKAFMPQMTTGISVWLMGIGLCTNFFLLRILSMEEEDEEEKEERPWEKYIEKEPRFPWYQYLRGFVVSIDFWLFLWIFGGVRELLGNVVLLARLIPGGYFVAALCFSFWKLTGKMPDRLQKLPISLLSIGLVTMVLYGLVGLI